MVARVLVVAGSDCSGGAGLQADIKTITALGAYASCAVTAVTVQDGQAVHEIHELNPLLVERQMECALLDVGADAIKLGMLGSALTVELVARVCERLARALPIVLDPVFQSSTHTPLLDDAGIGSLLQRLVPRVALLTPNVPEAQRLTGVKIASVEDMMRAADAFQLMGVSAVLIKGGHLPTDQVVDLLRTADGVQRVFETPRVDRVTRGTGCTLAAGIAAGLAEGMTLESAVGRAHDFVSEALKQPACVPGVRPPLFHAFRCAPELLSS